MKKLLQLTLLSGLALSAGMTSAHACSSFGSSNCGYDPQVSARDYDYIYGPEFYGYSYEPEAYVSVDNDE